MARWLLEMLFGSNPNQSNPLALVFTRLSATQFTLSFPQSVEFPADEVRVEWSVDATTWSTAGVVMTAQPAVNGISQVNAAITSPLPRTRIFVRVATGE